MTIRSPPSFALAILCLASSGTLGVLVHDGEVGATALAASEPGDAVRFKATSDGDDLHGFLSSWSQYGPSVEAFDLDGLGVLVVHEGDPVGSGTWIVEGVVQAPMSVQGASYVVVRAATVTAPLVFA